MTGKELARVIRSTKGKVAVPIYNPNHDVLWVFVEKADLIATVERYERTDIGLCLRREEGGDTHYLDSADD